MSDSDDIVSTRYPITSKWMHSDEDSEDKESISENKGRTQLINGEVKRDSGDSFSQLQTGKSKKFKKRKRVVKSFDSDESSNDGLDSIFQLSETNCIAHKEVVTSLISQETRLRSNSLAEDSRKCSESTYLHRESRAIGSQSLKLSSIDPNSKSSSHSTGASKQRSAKSQLSRSPSSSSDNSTNSYSLLFRSSRKQSLSRSQSRSPSSSSDRNSEVRPNDKRSQSSKSSPDSKKEKSLQNSPVSETTKKTKIDFSPRNVENDFDEEIERVSGSNKLKIHCDSSSESGNKMKNEIGTSFEHMKSNENEEIPKKKMYLLLSDGDLSNSDDDKVNKDFSDEGLDTKQNRKKQLHKPKEEVKKFGGEDDVEPKPKPKPKPRKPRKKKTESVLENGEKETNNSQKVRKPCKSAAKGEEKIKLNKRKSKEAKLEIKRTTQRMIREGQIALPYHQPKQHTLEEFLQRRTKIPFIPLKPTLEALSLIDEQLHKKEEEVIEFYKSKYEYSDIDANNEESMENNPQKNVGHTNGCRDFEEDETMKNINDLSDAVSRVPENIDTSSTFNFQLLSEVQVETETISNISPNENLDAVPIRSEISNANTDVEAAVQDKWNTAISIKVPTGSEMIAAVNIDIPTNLESIIEIPVHSDSNYSFNVDVPTISKPNTAANKIVQTDSKSNTNFDYEIPANSYLESELSLQIKESENLLDSEPYVASSQLPTVNTDLEIRTDVRIPTIEIGRDVVVESIENEPVKPAEKSTNVFDPKISAELIRDRKLELLSKLNIELSSSISLRTDCSEELEFDVLSVKSPGVERLLEKLFKHNVVEQEPKKKSRTLNILRSETDKEGEIIDVVKETFCLKNSTEVPDQKFVLPGSKYSHFKSEMLKTLINKKEANWEEYQREKRRIYASDDDEDDKEEVDDVNFDSRKPNFEPYHPEDEPNDDELVEDDVELCDDTDNKKKNEYLDEEAEVSFDEEENIIGDYDRDDSEIENSDEDENNSENDDNEVEAEDENDAVEESGPIGEKSDRKFADNESDLSPSKNKEREPFKCTEKLFRNEISAEDLENKLLGLEAMKTQNFDDSSNSQIFSVCSGKFVTQQGLPSQDENSSQFFLGEDSQNFNLSMQETNDNFTNAKEITYSFVKSNLLVSDESDTEELFIRRKKTMGIQDSDDESNLNESSQVCNAVPDGEENKLNKHEEIEDGGNEYEDGVEEVIDELGDEFDYNSDEEIVNNEEEVIPTDFFENEAELSESDWDSEDENEKDLDELEKEAGDDDDIDAEKLKEELGKIHMRQLLDDDHKDLRLLKEMLLEDGELHSDVKRSRKFQWKNIDGEDVFLGAFNDSDDENAPNNDNDLENEENWRKIRHEREMYLSQQEKRKELLSVEDVDDNFVQVAKIAKTKITVKTNLSATPKVDGQLNSSASKLPVDMKYKCGSFLSRSKLILARIAGNIAEAKDNVRGAKNGRNFVFAAVSPEKKVPTESANIQKSKKRGISSKSVVASKKIKLSLNCTNTSTRAKTGLLAQLALCD